MNAQPPSLAPVSTEPPPSPHFQVEFFLDNKREWRWRCLAPNHKVVADSAESYKNYRDALRMALNLFSDNEIFQYINLESDISK